jgi:hypothetical protein
VTDAGKGVYLYCCALSDALPEAPRSRASRRAAPRPCAARRTSRRSGARCRWRASPARARRSASRTWGGSRRGRCGTRRWWRPSGEARPSSRRASARSSPAWSPSTASWRRTAASCASSSTAWRGWRSGGSRAPGPRQGARAALSTRSWPPPARRSRPRPACATCKERRLRAEGRRELRRWLPRPPRRALDELSHRARPDRRAQARPPRALPDPSPRWCRTGPSSCPAPGGRPPRGRRAPRPRAGRLGPRLRLSGPFPPYSFTPAAAEPGGEGADLLRLRGPLGTAGRAAAAWTAPRWTTSPRRALAAIRSSTRRRWLRAWSG